MLLKYISSTLHLAACALSGKTDFSALSGIAACLNMVILYMAFVFMVAEKVACITRKTHGLVEDAVSSCTTVSSITIQKVGPA